MCDIIAYLMWKCKFYLCEQSECSLFWSPVDKEKAE